MLKIRRKKEISKKCEIKFGWYKYLWNWQNFTNLQNFTTVKYSKIHIISWSPKSDTFSPIPVNFYSSFIWIVLIQRERSLHWELGILEAEHNFLTSNIICYIAILYFLNHCGWKKGHMLNLTSAGETFMSGPTYKLGDWN